MPLESLFIINKSGGLIYNKSFSNPDGKSAIGSNDLLIFAGTLHSAFTLTSCILPDSLAGFSESYHHNSKYEQDGVDGNKENEIELPLRATEKSHQKLPLKTKYHVPGSSIPKTNVNMNVSQNGKMQSIVQHLTFKGSDLFFVDDSTKPQLVDYHHISAIRHISTEHVDIYCHQSVTGTKFVSIFTAGDSRKQSIDRITCFLMRVYSVYSDVILKNPFYSLDMPIRNNAKFDAKITGLVQLEGFV